MKCLVVTTFLACLTLVFSGCITKLDRNGVPTQEQACLAAVSDYPESIRLIAYGGVENLFSKFDEFLEDIRVDGGADGKFSVLSLSGGGENGAYAAGLINGWREAGNCPEFDIVTGVSTGSLIAPMAFLGARYDEILKRAYTEIDVNNIFTKKSLYRIMHEPESLTDSTPLSELIAAVLDEEAMARIAEEHRKGRRLFVVTTNLDERAGVMWDIGAIANSGNPDSLNLIHQVLLASSSIPIIFQPVLINVTIGEETYDELHVDGGVVTQSFGAGLLDPKVMRESKNAVPRELYIIQNGWLEPRRHLVKRNIASITDSTLSTMFNTCGLNDIIRSYFRCKAIGADFNCIDVPEDFDIHADGPFDKEFMQALYHVGYDFGKNSQQWMKVPPMVRDNPEVN